MVICKVNLRKQKQVAADGTPRTHGLAGLPARGGHDALPAPAIVGAGEVRRYWTIRGLQRGRGAPEQATACPGRLIQMLVP